MKKIWFFVEGDSEENLVVAMVHHNYPDVIIERDESKFIAEYYERRCCYCVNAGNVDKLPYLISEYCADRRIEKSQSNDVVVICDIENLKCNSSRKNKIEYLLDDSSKQLDIKYIFFNPMIEKLYWDCPEIIGKVLQATLRKRNIGYAGEVSIDNTQIATKKYHYKLHELFKKYGLKYRKNQFSKEFFNRVDYKICNNLVILRLVNYMNFKLDQGEK
jgi:hypothetical protein